MKSTGDTAERMAFMPDWREGVIITQAFETSVQRSRAGLEQSNRRRKAPVYRLEYVRTGLTPAEAKQRLEGIRTEFRNPLTVPIWTDGIALQAAMFSVSFAVLDSNPITGEWVAPMDVFLWSSALGGEWRTLTAIEGRNLAFSGTGTLYPVGSLVFPSRRMIREVSEGMLSAVDVESGTEFHRYRTL